MAKSKVKGKKTVDSCCAPACVGDYKPRLYIDLRDKDVSQIKGLTVGEKVQMLVEGKVVGLEQRERSTEGEKKENTGSIQLEGYEVEVLGEDNEFAQLVDDDE